MYLFVHSFIQHSSAPGSYKEKQKQVNSFIRNTLLFVRQIQTTLVLDNFNYSKTTLGKVAYPQKHLGFVQGLQLCPG